MTKRLHVLSIAALITLAIASACGNPPVETGRSSQGAASAGPAEQPDLRLDTSKAPGADDPEPRQAGGSPFNLRVNSIRTRHVFDGAITAGKIAFVATTVTINAASATGSSAADPLIAGGFLVSCDPGGAGDQIQKNAVLNGDGSITVTLNVAATATNTYRCVSVKPNAKGVS